LLTGHPDDLFPHPPWARIATSDEQREHFLELADKWMSDAKSIDQGIELRPTEAAKASEMRDLRNDAHIGVGQLLKRERMPAVLVSMAIGEA
jgi:hypothetical protein